MSRRSCRAVLAAVVAGLATLAFVASASAMDPRTQLPTPDPLTLPHLGYNGPGTGYCLGFDVLVTWTDFKQFIVRETTTNGTTTLQIAGKAKATVTNTTTGESISLNISGPGTIVINSDNSFSVDAAGPNLFWTEQKNSFNGVPTISYTTGHVTFAVNAGGLTTSYTLAGGARQTDVCAVLA
jgi:hypothetical protein